MGRGGKVKTGGVEEGETWTNGICVWNYFSFRCLWSFFSISHSYFSVAWQFCHSSAFPKQSASRWYLPTLVAGTSLTIHLSLASCLYVLSICLFQMSFSVPHLSSILMPIHLSPLKS